MITGVHGRELHDCYFTVEESGDSAEDREARALLNKFLGASVLMSGMESMMASSSKEEVSNAEGAPGTKKVSAEPRGSPIEILLKY